MKKLKKLKIYTLSGLLGKPSWPIKMIKQMLQHHQTGKKNHIFEKQHKKGSKSF